MRTVPIEKVPSKAILGRDVYSASGLLLLPKGTPLSDDAVAYLRHWDVSQVTLTSAPPSQNRVKPEVEEAYLMAVSAVRRMLDGVRYGAAVPIRESIPELSGLILALSSTTGVLEQLHLLQQEDDYTFQHSINVGVVSLLIGKWLKLPAAILPRLSIAAVFHDVGKAQLPLEILNKPGALTSEEFAEVKRHPELGREILVRELADEPDMPDLVAPAAAHHERENGSGYPLGLHSRQIHPWAKIVAVADVYDAMTSDRVYRRRVSHFDVMDQMVGESYGLLDPKVTRTFFAHVMHFGIGQEVRLSDGRIGSVVFIDRLRPARPLVKIEGLGEPVFVNLATEPQLGVKDVIRP